MTIGSFPGREERGYFGPYGAAMGGDPGGSGSTKASGGRMGGGSRESPAEGLLAVQ